MYKLKRFFYKVIRLFKFIPVIWDDDWDFESEYIAYLQKKLEHIYKVLDTSYRYLGVQEDLKKIQIVLHHIRRYNDLQNCEHKYRQEPKGYEAWLLDWSDERHKNKKEKYYRCWVQQTYKLEQYHWEEIHKYICKYSKSWWD